MAEAPVSSIAPARERPAGCTAIALLTVIVWAGAGRPESARGQTCAPFASCAGALYCGGQWEFESGFVFVPHMLAGQCASPPGGGNQSCVPADKTAQVGQGWTHWASFPDWPTSGYWGTIAFNANQFCPNTLTGSYSQETTMTCANGVGGIYRTAAVPAGHRIRVEANMRWTFNGAGWPPVEHSLGLDPTGGTDPKAATVQWHPWDAAIPVPPMANGVFNLTSETVDMVSGPNLTIFIRQLAREPPCQGQTFMIDNVKVFDDGPLDPTIELQPTSLAPAAVAGSDAPAGAFTVRNAGSLTLNYDVAVDAGWLSVNPTSGSSTGEAVTIDVTYDTDALAPGIHGAAITVTDAAAANSPQIVAVQLTINKKPGDLDGDGDADQADFGLFQACYTGPGAGITVPACHDADLDHDNHVDGNDFGLFQACMSGAGAPSDPNCAS